MPPQEKKQYIIQFVYVENGHIFSTGAMLDSEEKRDLERILNAYATPTPARSSSRRFSRSNPSNRSSMPPWTRS